MIITDPILKLSGVNKAFRNGNLETLAMNQVNLSVQPGEFVALMGPSGCGKSTLLNVASLLDTPTVGKVTYLGQDLSQAGKKKRHAFRRDNIGFIFQGFNLIEEMDVLSNVALPLKFKKEDRKTRERKALECLERLGIEHRAGHKPSKLSGGQQQRAAIARAVVGEPHIIFADEPTGNLDSFTGDTIMSLLKELSLKGSTLVMVTHSSRDASYADRVVNMMDGSITG